jgi:O-acetyl-ADP-ribose deacetylase (regulator of RNase III)
MISFEKNNILHVKAEALVNSVNLTGVMGKGIALAFRETFPENYKLYRKACEEKEIDIGKIFVTETDQFFPKYIINFPTKKHWRLPSKYEWIEAGLISLKEWLRKNEIRSIAIPPLGSGNGKLDWVHVKVMIQNAMKEFENRLDIIVIEPSEQFETKPSLVKPETKLTPARAMLLYIMSRYQVMGYEINLLVVQKIAYILQRLGEPLKLRFEKGYYGPFAYNLLPVLKAMKPYYLNYKSLDDAKPSTVIKQNQLTIEEVEQYIELNLTKEQKDHLDMTLALIKDFETPFGLELLGTVDYIFTQENRILDSNEVLSKIKNWTTRKKKLFKQYHIDVAKEKLQEYFSYN